MSTTPSKKSAKKRATKAAPRRGRPATYKTPDAVADYNRERNHAYQTSEAYKKRRRERYENDPAYREACQRRAREYAAQRRAGNPSAYARKLRNALTRLDRIGASREVIAPRKLRGSSLLSFTLPELATVIHRPAYVLREWVNSGRFPAPSIKCRSLSGPPVMVFTSEQVGKLAEAAALFLKTQNAHLTASRTDAISAFHRAVR